MLEWQCSACSVCSLIYIVFVVYLPEDNYDDNYDYNDNYDNDDYISRERAVIDNTSNLPWGPHFIYLIHCLHTCNFTKYLMLALKYTCINGVLSRIFAVAHLTVQVNINITLPLESMETDHVIGATVL